MSKKETIQNALRDTIENVLRTDDRAVSPVIGVILMVAITVILAAVIGTFVLDLGQSVGNTGPTVSMSMSDADANFDPTGDRQDVFVLEHQGGDELDLETSRITIRNVTNNNLLMEWDGTTGVTNHNGSWSVEHNNANITTGSSATVESGDVLLIRANPDSGDPDDGFDYKILVSDTGTSNTVAQATIELS